jgi:hypothetical protein
MNNHKTCRLMTGGLVVCGAFFVMALTSTAQAKDKIEVGDMPNVCKQKAASKFDVNSDDVMTLPAEKDNKGKYFVYGQTPAEGQNALFFTCKFNDDREFVKVEKKSDNRTQSQSGGSSHSNGGGGIAVQDMSKYCAGEASAKFHQRPNRITTQHAIKDQGMYSVWGQYEAEPNPQLFICTFSAEGKLVGVDLHNPGD